MTKKINVVLILTLVSLLICAKIAVAQKKNSSINYDDLLTSVDQFIQSNVENGFSGVALIADKKGIIFHKAYSGKGDKIETTTAYGIASQAKSLTALAIMQLHERGKLSVNDSITKYFDNIPADKKDITIRQLLTHTSGLDECECLDGATAEQKLIDGILQTTLGNPIGSKWVYANENFYLLGLIVEKVAKMRFGDYVQKNILDVAGMTHTGQSGQEKAKSVVMAPIDLEMLKKQPVYQKNYENGQLKKGLIGHRLGAYFSTTGDMYKLAFAMRRNKLISNSTLAISLEPQTSGFIRAGLYWGYGWVYTMAEGRRINIFNSGREDWAMNSRMYLLENGYTIIVWSRDTKGPETDAAATVVSLKLVEMFERL